MLWIVGKVLDQKESGETYWELQGVFSSEEKALKVARFENYFVGPVLLDKELPDETVEWPGCYYPKLGN